MLHVDHRKFSGVGGGQGFIGELDRSLRVTYYHRRPGLGCYSIERLFSAIRAGLPPSVDWKVAAAPCSSVGFLRRLYNVLDAVFRQGDVNHITGDIHYIAALLRKGRTVLTIHDCVSLERLRGAKKTAVRLLWYWLPVKRSAIVTVISESTKRELLRYVKCDPRKIRVVYNCILPEFVPWPREFNHSCPTILQVGTAPNKNLRRVAEALEGIRCRLQIIGKLSEEQKETLACRRIDYAAAADVSDDELVQSYRNADLVVFASTYEGFGLPIIEANATGRPVVTSDVYSMPEVAGDAACIVDPFDVKSIRAGILRIIQDPVCRSELVRNGFKNVERFRSRVIAAEYTKLYYEIVDGNRHAE